MSKYMRQPVFNSQGITDLTAIKANGNDNKLGLGNSRFRRALIVLK